MKSKIVGRNVGNSRSVALTIAGSDCSGGAGIQADLKTFAAHGVYGMSALTCVVAENPQKVVSMSPVPVLDIQNQIACCLKDMPSVFIKTGMLYSASTIRACRDQLSKFDSQYSVLVVDPVMVATSGRCLLQPNAIRALKDFVREYADLVTPNLDEAEILVERKIRTESEMEVAAKTIHHQFRCAVLLKGGHLKNARWALDFCWDGKRGFWLRSKRVPNVKTHGTGCTYSAAIVANLARGCSLLDAVRKAKVFVTNAIRQSYRFGPWMALNHHHHLASAK